MLSTGPKPYPAYKNSGVPWLGDVPEHWEVRRLKRVCRFEYGEALLTELREDGAVSVLGSNGRVGFHSANNAKGPCVVIGRKGSFGKVTYSPDPVFAIDTTFFVDSRQTRADMRWLFYCLYLLRLDDVSRDSAVPGLDREESYQRSVPFPPSLAEQSGIARYLDRVDRRIQRYVRTKRKLIELLEEQKRATIDQAVTRGLDPSVRLKPSGVEWLGDVPEHWRIMRLKDVAVVQTGLTLGKDYRGLGTEPHPYLRVANVQHGHLDLREVKTIRVPRAEAAGSTLRSGDVLMTEGGDIDKLGRGCVWRGEISDCLHQNHVFAVRCREQALLPEFLVGMMISGHGRAYFQRTAKKTTNLASTNSTILRAFPVLLPPVAEQKAILARVTGETAQIEAAISSIERQISLVREHHARLIADVVTGKLDVREAAKLGSDSGAEGSADEFDLGQEYLTAIKEDEGNDGEVFEQAPGEDST